jgi:succinyl-CoA synthetase beta subunit
MLSLMDQLDVWLMVLAWLWQQWILLNNLVKNLRNFLDLGGTANKDRVIMGFKTIQSDPNVKSILINIFGGIIHCDMIANGIVDAVKELDFKLPLVVRFQGTNAKEGKDKINNSDLGLISIDDFTEAAKKVVELAKG